MKLLLRIFLILALVLAGWNVVHRIAAVQEVAVAEPPQSLQAAIQWDPRSPDYHFQLGMLHRDQPRYLDPALARTHLKQAVDLHPYHWRYWLELARLHEISGSRAEALRSYQRAVQLNPRSALYRWRLAHFYLREGAVEDSLDQFGKAMELDFHSYGITALALLWKSGLREVEIERIWPSGTAERLRLLQFLVTKHAAPGYLGEKWAQLLEQPKPPSIGQSSSYLAHLMKTDPGEARRQWARVAERNGLTDAAFQHGKNMVWNGSFELGETSAPLDWQIRDYPGYRVKRAEGEGVGGSRAVRFNFDGKENLTRIGMEQHLVVEPSAEYEFSFQARCEELSTDQGIYFQVRASDSSWNSQRILGSRDWARYSGNFTVPEGVETAVVWLGRNPSRRIDSLIGGQLWLDSITLRGR